MKLAGLRTLSWDLAPAHTGCLSCLSLSCQIPACTCSEVKSVQYGPTLRFLQWISHIWPFCPKSWNTGLIFLSAVDSSVYKYLISSRKTANRRLSVNDRTCLNRVRSSRWNSWQTMPYLFHDIICLPWIRILCSVPEWYEISRITMVSTPIKTTSLKFMEQQMFTLQKTMLDKSWGPTDDC